MITLLETKVTPRKYNKIFGLFLYILTIFVIIFGFISLFVLKDNLIYNLIIPLFCLFIFLLMCINGCCLYPIYNFDTNLHPQNHCLNYRYDRTMKIKANVMNILPNSLEVCELCNLKDKTEYVKTFCCYSVFHKKCLGNYLSKNNKCFKCTKYIPIDVDIFFTYNE